MLVLVVTCTTERCVAVMGISPEVQLLAAQITAAGNGFGIAVLAALVIGSCGPDRSGGCPGLSAKQEPHPRERGAKKDEEHSDPAVLNDFAWLRSLRLYKYTPNFEVVESNGADVREGAGRCGLGAKRKMLKMFEVVGRKMGIDDPPPSASLMSTLGSSIDLAVMLVGYPRRK